MWKTGMERPLGGTGIVGVTELRMYSRSAICFIPAPEGS